jgi:hypothetical protein
MADPLSLIVSTQHLAHVMAIIRDRAAPSFPPTPPPIDQRPRAFYYEIDPLIKP